MVWMVLSRGLMTLNAYVHVSWDGYRLILDHIENFNLQFFLIWSGIFLLLPMSVGVAVGYALFQELPSDELKNYSYWEGFAKVLKSGVPGYCVGLILPFAWLSWSGYVENNMPRIGPPGEYSYWQAFGLVGTAIIISVILNLKNRLLLVPGITVPLGITMGMATVFVVIESTVPDNISGLATAYTSVVGTLILIVVNLPLSIWKFRKNKPRIEGNAQ